MAKYCCVFVGYKTDINSGYRRLVAAEAVVTILLAIVKAADTFGVRKKAIATLDLAEAKCQPDYNKRDQPVADAGNTVATSKHRIYYTVS